jgi:hypothetical protein
VETPSPEEEETAMTINRQRVQQVAQELFEEGKLRQLIRDQYQPNRDMSVQATNVVMRVDRVELQVQQLVINAPLSLTVNVSVDPPIVSVTVPENSIRVTAGSQAPARSPGTRYVERDAEGRVVAAVETGPPVVRRAVERDEAGRIAAIRDE